MTEEQLLHIIKQGENQTAEFKTSFSDDVIVSLAAFSNAKGGAVYIGVTDDGVVKDVELGKETVAQWINDTEPKFELISDGFQVTVFGDEFFNEIETIQETIQETMQEREQEINPNTIKLLQIMEDKMWTVSELMSVLKLNGRRNFLYTYLHPAIKGDYVSMLYPDNPRHRGQKYFLTEKGKKLVNQQSRK